MSQSNRKKIDPLKIKISYYDQSRDDFSKLNFKQKDGSDPLNVDKFIHNNPSYQSTNHISKIYSVRYEDQLTAFFTLSMSQIEFECMNNDNKEDDDDDESYDCISTSKVKFDFYPALLVRQLGIDKDFKGQGLGYYILLYCLGLGQILSQRVGCAFLVMRTTNKLAEKYYGPRYNFKWEKNSNKKKVWVYRKLFSL